MHVLLLLFALTITGMSSTTDVEDSYSFNCKAVGTKEINISWMPLTQLNNSLQYNYSVYFCKQEKSCYNKYSNFKLGCTVTSVTSTNISTCNIGEALQLNYPYEYKFLYFVRIDNGLSRVEGAHMECRLNTNMKCTVPEVVSVKATNKRQLTLTWRPPRNMGVAEHDGLLCYRIHAYCLDDGVSKIRDVQSTDNFSYTIRSLSPYKSYKVSIQCALDCSSRNELWSDPSEAIKGQTQEETPQGTIRFVKYQNHDDEAQKKRNITIFFKLPSKEMWNGNVTHVKIYCYKGQELCSIKKVSPKPHIVSFHSLEKTAVYYLQGQYCNSEGCSKLSSNLTVKGDVTIQKDQSVISEKSSKDNKEKIIIAVVCGAVAIVFIAVTSIFCWWCKRRNHGDNEAPLDDIVNPNGVEPSPSESGDEDENIDQTNSEYASVYTGHSKTTLHAETMDFRSASARSLNSFNMSLADQSRNESLMTIPSKDNESLLEHQDSMKLSVV